MKTETRILLVDSHHGVYSWHNLASRYPLFVGSEHIPLEDFLAEYMPEESLKTVFDPENEHWCENVDYLNDIYVKADDGSFWRVEQDEDIWAINPAAEWNEQTEEYFLPETV